MNRRLKNPFEHITSKLADGGRCYYMPNGGNLGDALIASATIQGFNKYDIDWQFIRGRRNEISTSDILVYGGGGSLVSHYMGGKECVSALLETGAEVVVLPQTLQGHMTLWQGQKGKRLTVFARDYESLAYISQFGHIESYFYHDLATELDLGEDPFSIIQGIRDNSTMVGTKLHLNAFRRDGEAAVIQENSYFDISGSAYPSMQSELVIHASSCSLLACLSSYSSVSTDRLHTAIAACLLGIRVELHDTIHRKNSGVYNSSLKYIFPEIICMAHTAYQQ